MRKLILNSYLAGFMLGVGGYNVMRVDYTQSLETEIFNQFTFLNFFGTQILNRELSNLQIRNRATFYTESSTQATERGRAAKQGVYGSLPTYPADGTQI